MPRRPLVFSLHACAIALLSHAAAAQPQPSDPPPSAPPSWGAPGASSPPSAPGQPAAPPLWSPPRPWTSVDPLVPASVMVVATGVAFAVPGFFALGAQAESVCGLTGCVDVPNVDARARASGFLGASGAMLLVGLPTLIMAASGPSPEAGARRSPRAAMFGAWLTGYGAGAAAYGFGTAIAAGNSGKVEGVAVALGIGSVGLAMLAAGIPLWAVGTRPVRPAERTPDSMRPARSEARTNVGLTLTSLGFVTTGVGSMAIANLSAERGDFAGYGVALIGIPILVGGTILLGVGLPLWLTGAGPKAESASSLLPSIGAGPTSLSLTWSLQ